MKLRTRKQVSKQEEEEIPRPTIKRKATKKKQNKTITKKTQKKKMSQTTLTKKSTTSTSTTKSQDDCDVWIDKDEAKAEYFPYFFTKTQSSELLNHLLEEEDTQFKQYEIKVFNKQVLTPRLECAFADSTVNLTGYTHRTVYPWTPELQKIKAQIETFLTQRYNEPVVFEYALANIYKTGDHYIGYHADRENIGTTIASISLGAERCFKMKHKKTKEIVVSEDLLDGSLLVMSGKTQDLYKHALPKTKKVHDLRINITFRMRKEKDRK
jgi:alkylated DNA repair dioxygenase AlkB